MKKNNVTNSDFRIVQYKDHYRVEKKILIDIWFYLFGIALYIKGQKETWNCILKDNSYLSCSNFVYEEKYKYKTKKECEQFISDYNKYPIYHYF